MNITRLIAVCAAITLVFINASAFAALVITPVNSPGSGGGTSPGDPGELEYAPDVSNSDLLQGLVGVQTGIWAGGGIAALNNGTHGESFDNDQTDALGQIAWPTVGASVVYTLGAGDNGLGYDITEIQSIAAWQSAGFGNQGYNLEVRPLGGSFSLLTTVTYTPLPADPDPNGAGATKVNITDSTGILATGIDAIRFTHLNLGASSAGGRTTYRELDVFGTSTVPEPNSLTLLGIGGLLVLYRYRGTFAH